MYTEVTDVILDNVKVLLDKLVDERVNYIFWCTLILLFYQFLILAIAINLTGNVT